MIITCPQCAAAYSVDAMAFGRETRVVQCSACGQQWRQAPSSPPVDVPGRDTLSDATLQDRSALAHPSVEEAARPIEDEGDEVPRPPASRVKPNGDPTARRPDPPSDASARAGDKAAETPTPAEDGNGDGDLDFSSEGTAEDDAAASEDKAASTRETTETAIGDEHAPPPPPPAAPHGKGRPWWRPVAAGAVGFGLLLAAMIGLRETITSAVPALAPVYTLIGLGAPVIGEGLDIRDVSTAREWSGGDDVLSVTGLVFNNGERRRDVPSLRVGLFDGEDHEVQGITVPPSRATLAPGESLRFQARIVNPSDTARRIRVRFQADAPANP